MEIACISLAVQTREDSIWKLLAMDVRPSERQGTTVQTWLISRKNFSEILGQLIAQLSVRTAHDYHPDGVEFLSSQTLF
jgi:hypothetical protein